MNYPNFYQNSFMANQQFNPQIPTERFGANSNNQFVLIQNENEVLNYPVAPGNSVSFKHQTEPFIYIKTMGLSQFDRPKVVKYKLTEEELGTETSEPNNSTPIDPKWLKEDDLKPVLDEIQTVKHEIEDIKHRIDEINNSAKASTKPSSNSSKEK